MNGLATVDPADMAVAKFFVFAVLGADYDQSPYTQTGDRVAELAARGVRLVIEEFRTDVTKTRKGRQPRCAADRLRRPAQAREADRVAVEIHRRR